MKESRVPHGPKLYFERDVLMASEDEIEANTLRILKSIDFQVTGYYRYEHAINLVGYLKQPEPFTIPTKMAVEIAKGSLNRESVESFAKFGNNVLAQKLAIFHEQDFDNLNGDVKSTISAFKIDYLGGETLRKALSKSTVTQEEARRYRNSLDILSPKRLVEALPELSHQKIPNDIRSILGSKFKAWEIMEDAVFAAFSHCLGYETRKLGHEKRFEPEPEGEVATLNQPPFAFLYDCKSARDVYSMSKDDERAVIGYVDNKKGEITARYRCELRYFVMVGPDFNGRFDLRRDSVHNKTNVILVFIKAEALRNLSLWAYNLPPRYKGVVDLREIFKIGEKIINEQIVEAYKQWFDSTHQTVYESD